MCKQLFVAATRQNDGKTMVSLGLFYAMQERFKNVAYMKPVGQQYKLIDGKKIDKDAVLFQSVYDLQDNPELMSPIAVPRGFTENYIDTPNKDQLLRNLHSAHASLTKDKDFMLIEGTGHAGVGSVFDMSNATVAKELGTKVVLVSLGGIGRAIDEIMLNKAVFDLMGVELLGVIINKIKQDKYDKICSYTKKGLERQGIPVLGTIPFVGMLTNPSVSSVFEGLKGELLSGKNRLWNRVEKCVIGDMVPQDALDDLSRKTLLIVPANREGLILSLLCGNILEPEKVNSVSAIILTNGKRPHEKVLSLIQRSNIPLMLVEEDSYSVATRINQLLVKVKAEETEKIEKMQSLVKEYVDVDKICSSI